MHLQDTTCTPNKNIYCTDISNNWHELKTKLISLANNNIVVKFKHFETVTQYRQQTSRLKAFEDDVNMEYIQISFPIYYLQSYITETN